MSYINTFITIANDCPVEKSEIPVARNGRKPAHLLQYELLQENPYKFGHEDLIFEVFVRQREIPVMVLKTDAGKIKKELFSKGHPCLRASALVKRYGFGAHYNQQGKIAIYPMESGEYQSLAADEGIKLIAGMRTKKL